MPSPTAVKACTRCEVCYPVASGFAKDQRASDGLQSQCRACNRERARIWYAANQERARAQREEFATIHPERKQEHDVSYYATHLEAIRAKQRTYRQTEAAKELKRCASKRHYQSHKAHERERNRERNQRWRLANPDKVRDRKARRYVRIHGGNFEKVDLSVLVTRDGGRCGLCGKRVRHGETSIDHIVPLFFGGEHTYANTQLAHLNCNRRRQHRGPAQLRMVG